MNEVVPGVHHWTAPHPRIGKQVHSHYVADAATLIDPMVPPEGMPELRPAPERVVLSARHHLRDAQRFLDEFGSLPMLCHEDGLHEFGDGDPQVGAYRFGDELAPGITAQPMGAIAPDDTVLYIRARGQGLLAFADALIRWQGEPAFVPDFLMDEPERTKAGILRALDDLLELDFQHLLFAHGEPLVGGGRSALEDFMASPRSADFG
ncbi:MAG: hypothetical protein M3088_00980 [Actinomycetota bacterium]|nr:hypothetical protein [Actinomycetota bacterium]